MPRRGPVRAVIHVRVSQGGLKFLGEEEMRFGVSRSDVIRAALKHWAGLPERDRHRLVDNGD